MKKVPPQDAVSDAVEHAADNTVDPFDRDFSTPEAQGVDSRGLIRAIRRVRDEPVNLHSLIMIRNGRVIMELYLPPYDRDTLHNVKSVTKSIMSALVGIALKEGILDNLDRAVLDYFPEYVTGDMDRRTAAITLRHLLTMTSGLDLDENGPIMNGIFASDDWIGATFARPMSEDPGRRFLYCTALTHVMSGVLSRAGGKSLLELCDQYIFGPLGINGVQWRQDPHGHYFGGSELFMSPRDMAKIGQLFLNRGQWNGKQVVPAEWVRESTRDNMTGIEADDGYGYWWLRIPLDESGYRAAGWGGQRICVFPRWNMVVVATSSDPDGLTKLFEALDTSSIGHAPLAPNPSAQRDLEALVADIEEPAPQPVPDLPGLATEISGHVYTLESTDGPLPYENIAFDFTGPDGAGITLGTDEGTYRLAVGLDGLYSVSPTGNFGRMPHDNHIAIRGKWTGEQSLAMDWLEIGDPNLVRLNIRFSRNRIDLSAHIEPDGTQLSLSGTRSPT